jgi:hypothetical protein
MIGRELAGRFGLRRVPNRQDWRGDCPLCGYAGAFVLSDRAGRILVWCASCQDSATLFRLLRAKFPISAHRSDATRDRNQNRERSRERAFALWHGSDPAAGTMLWGAR